MIKKGSLVRAAEEESLIHSATSLLKVFGSSLGFLVSRVGRSLTWRMLLTGFAKLKCWWVTAQWSPRTSEHVDQLLLLFLSSLLYLGKYTTTDNSSSSTFEAKCCSYWFDMFKVNKFFILYMCVYIHSRKTQLHTCIYRFFTLLNYN